MLMHAVRPRFDGFSGTWWVSDSQGSSKIISINRI